MAIIASYTIGPWLVKLVTGTNNPIVIKNATNYLKFDTLILLCESAVILYSAKCNAGAWRADYAACIKLT